MQRLLVVLVLLAGCASWIDDRAAASTYRILAASVQAAPRQADLELARDAMPSGIVQLEAFALAYPAHREFKVLHANAGCAYAVTFVFDDWEEASLAGRRPEADRIADRLRGLLDGCVAEQRGLLPAAWATHETPAMIQAMTREQVDPVLWIATAGAVRLALDPLKSLGELPVIRAELTRCAELAPGSRDAAAEVLLGTFLAGQAAFLGGDDGSAYFTRARKLAGEGVLNIDVMFARAVAVARRDRSLFTATLERVLAADPSRWPEHRLANELARKKARRYLAAADQLVPATR